MQHGHDEHKKHLALWIAVGGTMAVIAALWLMILPMQLRNIRFSGLQDAARWNATRSDQGDQQKMTFEQVLAQQRKQLEEIEKRTGNASPASSLSKIEELRAKIEAASKKDQTPPATNAPAGP